MTDKPTKKEENVTERLTRTPRRSVSDIINCFNLTTTDAGSSGYIPGVQVNQQAERVQHRLGDERTRLAERGDHEPGGQVSLAGVGAQQLCTRRVGLTERGVHEPGGQVYQAAGRVHQPCVDTGLAKPGYHQPGGQASPAAVGDQQMCTRRVRLVERGTHEPGGQVHQAAGRVHRPCTETGLAEPGDHEPGGQVGPAAVGDQQLCTRRVILAESGVDRPGGQVYQAVGREQQPYTETGILAGDLDCKLGESTCTGRSDVLLIPRLHCRTGAPNGTLTKPNIILNVDFVPTNDRKEPDAAAGMDCPQDQ